MNLAGLLLDLRDLIERDEPDVAGVVRRMEDAEGLAEFEVARFYLQKHLGARVASMARSEDPRVRRLASALVGYALPRAGYTATLRRLSKDPSPPVRQRAMSAAFRTGVREVALPDPAVAPWGQQDRYTYAWARERGAWNISGWQFGVVASRRDWVRRKKPRRVPPEAARPPLPTLKTRADVAALLGLASADELARFARVGDVPGSGYVSFTIPKRSGGERRILAPRAPLKALQRKVLREVLDRIPPHERAHGFVARRSVVTNAAPHAGAAVVVKLDLADFFPTITFHRVEGLFLSYGVGLEAASALASLCTHRVRLADGYVVFPGALPQGAPTSPAIANLVARRMDARLEGVAAKFGATYTRYADDLTFSFRAEPARLGRFLWWVDQVCQQEGFALHDGKRRVLRAGQQQRVTGVVVNERPTVPRAARRRFRAMLHRARTQGLSAVTGARGDVASALRGFAAYVRMVQPELGARWLADVDAVVTASRGGAP